MPDVTLPFDVAFDPSAIDLAALQAGQLARAQQIEQWARDTARPGERFDEKAAAAACGFFPRHLRHTEGEWAGRPFVLAPWQRAVVRVVFGWKRADGTRRFRRIYIEIPRKNGKTEFCAGLLLLILLGDGEIGGQVYSMAVDKDQAKIVFNKACTMVGLSPELSRLLEVFKTSIFSGALNAAIKPLSSTPSGKHGFSPSGSVADEIHEWPDGELADVVHKGMGARRQPLEVEITTAGRKGKGYGWERHDEAIKVLASERDIHELLPVIFAAEDEMDWRAPATWAHANPGLGVSPKLEFIAAECAAAIGNPRKENDFRRFHLDQWVEQTTRWIPLHVWDRNTLFPGTRDAFRALEDRLAGRRCFSGLDLASTRDLTSLTHCFPPVSEDPSTLEGRWAFLFRAWLPADNAPDFVSRTKVPWDIWQHLGAVTLTEGNITDYRAIKARLESDAEKFEIAKIGIDRWNATQLAVELADDGANVVMFGQGYASMSAPTKEFERLTFGGLIEHGNHPLARWALGNVAISQDAAGNIKADKEKSGEKIDPIVAGIMGLGLAVSAEEEAKPEYQMLFV